MQWKVLMTVTIEGGGSDWKAIAVDGRRWQL
jgi:hypothetical protein